MMENAAIAAENVCLNEQAKVLVWVTSPLGCKKIMQEASAYAVRENAELVVVSIQSPITDDWANKVRTLETLERAARDVGAQLTVEYSDNPLKSAFQIISTVRPGCMFTGIPEAGTRSAFVENVCQMAGDVPVYAVDRTGNAVRVDTSAGEIS